MEQQYVVVEIPKGSRNKYEWDEALGGIKLDRFLFGSVVYPTDYGYFPRTVADDGDRLGAMVCVSEPTFPGCLTPVKVTALFRMSDEKGLDDKDLPQQLRDEIAPFFSIYKQPEGHTVEVEGWRAREDALEIIDRAGRQYAERR